VQRVRGRLEELKPTTARVDGSRDLEVFLTDVRFRIRNLDQRANISMQFAMIAILAIDRKRI